MHAAPFNGSGSKETAPVAAGRSQSSENAIVIERSPDGNRAHVFGELDLSKLTELREIIDAAASEAPSIAVDLSACTYIDSTILGALVGLNRKYEGRFQIVIPPSGIVHRVFEITSLLRQLPVVVAKP